MELKLTNDYIFKYVFANEDNAPQLLALVNAVLEDSGFKPVVYLKIQNPTELKDADWLKEPTLDIKAKDESGAEYDIEIQVEERTHYRNRSLYYWSKIYANQLTKGDYYQELRPVICINIVNFVLFPKTEAFHTCFMLMDKKIPDTVLTEDLQIHFIELTKTHTLTGKLGELAALIKSASLNMEEEMTVLLQKDPVYKIIYDRYTRCLHDPIERGRAEAREKQERDIGSERLAGFNQGISQGAYQKALETAQKLLQMGLPKQQIAQATGLSLTEIQKL